MTTDAQPSPLDHVAGGHHVAGGGAARLARGLRAGIARVILQLLRWQELAAQRRALLQLDDHMLKDIGLSRADAWREGDRPFWDQGSEPWWIWR